jgi:LemA protein
MVAMTILGTIFLLLLFWAVGAYKRLSSLRAQCRTAYALLAAQLKARHALIPVIVETASGYMAQQHEALEPLSAASSEAVAAHGKGAARPADDAAMRRIAESENALAVALGAMRAAAESHPDLKADATMRALCEELKGAAKDIAFAWQFYNVAATQYNASRSQFPVSIVAAVFAFRAEALLPPAQPAGEHGQAGLAV